MTVFTNTKTYLFQHIISEGSNKSLCLQHDKNVKNQTGNMNERPVTQAGVSKSCLFLLDKGAWSPSSPQNKAPSQQHIPKHKDLQRNH